MAAEVRHGSVGEIPPAVPARAGEIIGVEGAVRRGADPQVPVEYVRDGLAFLGRVLRGDEVAVFLGVRLALPAPGPAYPGVSLLDRSDGAGLDQLDDSTKVFAGMDLGAHLGLDLCLGRGLGDDPAFVDISCQGLFTVDVFARLQGRQGGEGVGVFCRRDNHCVEVVELAAEIPKILVAAGLGSDSLSTLEVAVVHVTERDDVFVFAGIHMAAPPAADTDQADIELTVG